MEAEEWARLPASCTAYAGLTRDSGRQYSFVRVLNITYAVYMAFKWLDIRYQSLGKYSPSHHAARSHQDAALLNHANLFIPSFLGWVRKSYMHTGDCPATLPPSKKE